MALEIVLILLFILLNGLLAMAEMAVVSARKSRLQQLANHGDIKARSALQLAENPADFLSTVQIGITLISILVGAFSGATIADRVASWLAFIPPLAPYKNSISIGLVVMAITLLSLVFGELVPKRLALNNAESVASSLAGPMHFLSRLTLPLVRLLSFFTEFILHIFGVKHSTIPPVSEEEIKVLIEQGTQAGIFEEAEQDMVAGVFRLGDRRIGTLMTPRIEIVWLDLEDSPEEVKRNIIDSPYSRFPVAIGDLDQIQGVVQAKDLLARSLTGQPLDLKACLETPLYVPESTPALKLLDFFRESRTHLALVIDEFGGLQGLVTLTDILRAIVGDILSVDEVSESEAVRREDGSWLLDGMLPLDEFTEIFQLSSLPNVEKGYYQTLGGFVMDFLGRIPSVGDNFEWGGLRFEVVDMDGFRVDKVLVIPGVSDLSSENA
jgi:putative hemolysin